MRYTACASSIPSNSRFPRWPYRGIPDPCRTNQYAFFAASKAWWTFFLKHQNDEGTQTAFCCAEPMRFAFQSGNVWTCGIFSLSEDLPWKQGNFKNGVENFEGAERYIDWKFSTPFLKLPCFQGRSSDRLKIPHVHTLPL